MAIELIRKMWCDLCANQAEQVEAVRTLVVSLDGTFAEVDMCAEHAYQWADQLTDLIILGRETEQERKAAVRPVGRPLKSEPAGYVGDYGCPLCDSAYSNAESVRTHAYRAHVKTNAPPRYQGPCPECGMEFSSVQSLGSHRAGAHGLNWEASLLWDLERNGHDVEKLRKEAK